jgi:hypothetical protein
VEEVELDSDGDGVLVDNEVGVGVVEMMVLVCNKTGTDE